ncbi:hypothetical protein ACP4OV_024960 [Aristida adscensionis]
MASKGGWDYDAIVEETAPELDKCNTNQDEPEQDNNDDASYGYQSNDDYNNGGEDYGHRDDNDYDNDGGDYGYDYYEDFENADGAYYGNDRGDDYDL